MIAVIVGLLPIRFIMNGLDNRILVMISSLQRGDTMTEIKELRKRYGFTQQAFSDYLNIPKRSIENWESESATASRSCPPYLIELIAYKLAHEFPDK